MTKTNRPPANIIEGCLRGDRKSQKKFYERYSPKMYAVCVRLCDSSADAEDVLQEGFAKVFINLKTYRNEGSFDGWVRRIFYNTAAEQRRRYKLHHVSLEPFKEVLDYQTASPFCKLFSKDLEILISNQSKGYRTVFQLYAIEGYSHKEISDMMGISESTSKSQYCRARIRLQKAMEKGAHPQM